MKTLTTKTFKISFFLILLAGILNSWAAPKLDNASINDDKIIEILNNEKALHDLALFIIEKGEKITSQEYQEIITQTSETVFRNNPELKSLDLENFDTLFVQVTRDIINTNAPDFMTTVAAGLCGSRGFCCTSSGSNKVRCCNLYCGGRCGC